MKYIKNIKEYNELVFKKFDKHYGFDIYEQNFSLPYVNEEQRKRKIINMWLLTVSYDCDPLLKRLCEHIDNITIHPNRLKHIEPYSINKKKMTYICKNCDNKTELYHRSSLYEICSFHIKGGSVCNKYILSRCLHCKFNLYNKKKCIVCYYSRNVLNDMHVAFGKPNYGLKNIRAKEIKDYLCKDIYNIIKIYSQINM